MLNEYDSKFAHNVSNYYHFSIAINKESTQNMKYPLVQTTVVSEVPPHQSGIMALFVGSNSTLLTYAS